MSMDDVELTKEQVTYLVGLINSDSNPDTTLRMLLRRVLNACYDDARIVVSVEDSEE